MQSIFTSELCTYKAKIDTLFEKNWRKYPDNDSWLTKQDIILKMIQNRLAKF